MTLKFAMRSSFLRGASLIVPLAALVWLGALAAPAVAQPKKWLEMDYGPYLSTTVEAPQPAGNFAYKGIVIRLDGAKGGLAANDSQGPMVLFDTDTLRYAAAWNGKLNFTGIVYDGAHWAYPKTNGPLVYSNPVAPGWGKTRPSDDLAFEDPRFRGRDGKPYGPLPRQWGQWKGLYLHGNQVILSYTVDGTAILETPSVEKIGDQQAFVRTLEIAPGRSLMRMQVMRAGDRDEPVRTTTLVKLHDRPDDKHNAGTHVVAGCVSSVDDGAWLYQLKGDVVLAVAPREKPLTVKVIVWRGDAEKQEQVATAVAAIKPAAPMDREVVLKGGPQRWKGTVTTQAVIGKPRGDSPWAIDTLTLPDDNPWQSWMRLGGFDFFKDPSRAAVCTWSGDVWIVSGIKPGSELKELTWQRIATGMFQPLGLRIVDDVIYVCCRDQITRLHDLNGDGETDYYESFNHDHQVTEHFHEFAMDLQTDAAGDFYYAKSARHARDSLVEQHGTLLKVSKDGKTTTIVANGYRAANGVGIGLDGTSFYTSDQEGHWMPANRINLVREGSFSGNMFSYHRGDKPDDYDRPIVWLPKGFDRSPGEQLVTPDDRWGLPRGSLLSLSYGTGEILGIVHEPVKDHPRAFAQGAAFRLGLQFPTGIMRGRFHPVDGQLIACGLFGWSSNRTTPGGLYRVRYLPDRKVHVPVAWHVVKDGIVLRFSQPVDKETAADVGSYQVEQWDYKWTANYGSPEFKLSDGQRGRDTLQVASVTVAKDGRGVLLKINDLKPSMQIRIQYALETADGADLKQDLYGSIFVVPEVDGRKVLEGK